jgi:hypothetical protein
MLILSKLAGILVMVWFYTTGKKIGAPAIKWAIIGLIGYCLAWLLARETILTLFIGSTSKNSSLIFLITQTPVLFGLAAAFFVRKKMIRDAKKDESSSE